MTQPVPDADLPARAISSANEVQPVETIRITPNPPVQADMAGRVKIAYLIALTADALQILLSPILIEGVFSPFDDVLDFLVAAVLTWLMGWHLAFLPSFVLKVIPGVDLAPTWTIAVWIASRGKSSQAPATPEQSARSQ